MPPNKSKATAADKSDAGDGDKSFRWTTEIDQKLVSIMLTPRIIGSKEHADFAKAVGISTAGGDGVRNRVGKLRKDWTTAFEELCKAYEAAGIPSPNNPNAPATPIKSATERKTATPKTATAKGKKRGAKEMYDENVAVEDDEEVFGVKKMKMDEEPDNEFGYGMDMGNDIKGEPVDEI